MLRKRLKQRAKNMQRTKRIQMRTERREEEELMLEELELIKLVESRQTSQTIGS